MQKRKFSTGKILAAAGLLLLLFLALLFFYTAARLNTGRADGRLHRMTEEEQAVFFAPARAAWEKQRFGDLRRIPLLMEKGGNCADQAANPLDPADIRARSALILDAATGTVIFEKNAGEEIPPASMTKIAAMDTAFTLMEEKGISMDARAELPPESWAVNIPPRSSLMFLAEGQRVSMRELFAGMAVASGNDAAIAVAFNTAGSVEAFVRLMNGRAAALGMTKTRFTEPSGLSAGNRTTAREFAFFSKIYLDTWPWALTEFHSLQRLEYPKIWNLPEAAARNASADEKGNTSGTVVQYATNRLLGSLEGCDGLKTGYIDESGYNFSVTCARGNERFIAVLLGGPGANSYEGSRIRAEDGRLAMEWAFANFRTFRPAPPQIFAATVWGAEKGFTAVIPAEDPVFTVPVSAADSGSPRTDAKAEIRLHKTPRAPLYAGEILGEAVWYGRNGEILGAVDLLAAEDALSGPVWKRAADSLAERCARILGKIR